MSVLTVLQAELASATNQLLATAASLSDADVAAPSLLPGWTRGHVLAHVARNADSHLNLLTWARTGVRTPQYPTFAARSAEIEALSGRPAAEHLADLEDSASRLAAAFHHLPEDAWSATVEGMGPPPHPAWYLLVRRLREVGLHHVDLAAGYGPSDWTEPFVLRELHDCVACWRPAASQVGEVRLLGPGGRVTRTWTGLGAGPAVQGEPADLLAWLTGRSGGEGISVVPLGQSEARGGEGAGLPVPPPWPALPAPADLPATPPEDYP
ncbi:maleylpyruvate isomerase family mycothiol-dependent enzyme [Nonomuraea pusilla]|nr:maleylpyruvate isomerase family mycothiol-dependent enzyme [Nonomuraea pusilla]